MTLLPSDTHCPNGCNERQRRNILTTGSFPGPIA